jgi:SAM-dependent methyltransferase
MSTSLPLSVEDRAFQSLGTSADPIYRMVEHALEGRHPGGGCLLDVGCGRGQLWPFVGHRFDRYIGADVVCHEGFPAEAEFRKVNLDTGRVPLPDASADVVVAVETIEHLENPRAFFRDLVRLTRPGGWVLVTTPNQLSLLSKLTLLIKNQFNAFQDDDYPAHITALLEIDLRRMATETNLQRIGIVYSQSGRIILSSKRFPTVLSRRLPRAFSDNVLVVGMAGKDS